MWRKWFQNKWFSSFNFCKFFFLQICFHYHRFYCSIYITKFCSDIETGAKGMSVPTQALRLLAEAFYARYAAGENKSQAEER